MEKITCRTCQVTYESAAEWRWGPEYTNRDIKPTKIESNWCLNCKYLAKEEYELFYTFPKLKREIKSIKKIETLF